MMKVGYVEGSYSFMSGLVSGGGLVLCAKGFLPFLFGWSSGFGLELGDSLGVSPITMLFCCRTCPVCTFGLATTTGGGGVGCVDLDDLLFTFVFTELSLLMFSFAFTKSLLNSVMMMDDCVVDVDVDDVGDDVGIEFTLSPLLLVVGKVFVDVAFCLFTLLLLARFLFRWGGLFGESAALLLALL